MVTQISYFQCPVCAMSSPISKLSSRSLLDPNDLAIIQIRECRGRKGLPTVDTLMLLDVIDQYPEAFDRLKDITLGLIHSFYNHEFVKDEDLPNSEKFEENELKMVDLTEQIEKLKEDIENQSVGTYESVPEEKQKQQELKIIELTEQVEKLQEGLENRSAGSYDTVSQQDYDKLVEKNKQLNKALEKLYYVYQDLLRKTKQRSVVRTQQPTEPEETEDVEAYAESESEEREEEPTEETPEGSEEDAYAESEENEMYEKY